MDQQHLLSGFANIDRDGDPASLVRLLDTQGTAPFHQAYKRRAFALLGLQSGHQILDVGCGTGDDVRALARMVGPTGRVVGIDSSEAMIAEARKRSEGTELSLQFHLADATRSELADESFDGCLAIRTFQHLADPHQALSEMVRMVRPGRRVVIVDPDHETAVIDVPERALVRRFLTFRADTIRNGWIAHHMPALCKEVGLVDVVVTPMTQAQTDYAAVDAILGYEGGVRAAQAAGVLTDTEAERLVGSMQTAAGADRFFCAMTFFITSGRKP